MMAFVIVIHVIACAALIIIVLIQSGRGGGLVENLSGLETMFGTKTSGFLTRATTVLSIVFFITCLTLAFLSVRQSRSLMQGLKHQGAPASKAAELPPEEEMPESVEKSAEKPEPVPAAQEMPGEDKPAAE